jgi:hypothetical protein
MVGGPAHGRISGRIDRVDDAQSVADLTESAFVADGADPR